MKKYNYLFIILSIFSVIILTIFTTFLSCQLKDIQINKFHITTNYYKINVNNIGICNCDKNLNILNEIKNFSLKTKSTIIYDSINSIGTGIYDDKNLYTNKTSQYNNNSNINDIQSDTCKVYIKKDSFVQNFEINNIIDLGNNQLDVIGVYDKKCKLYTEEKNFIYPLLSKYTTSHLIGTYYIITDNNKSINNFIDLFDNEYQINFSYIDTSNKCIFNPIYAALKNNKLLFTTFIGLILAYINLYIFYKFLLSYTKTEIRIFSIFGATIDKILLSYLKKVVLNYIRFTNRRNIIFLYF